MKNQHQPKETRIYVYRYIWTVKQDDETIFNFKLLSGPVAEHNIFIAALKDNKNVIRAMRQYQSEFDISKLEEMQHIKGENENEKNS